MAPYLNCVVSPTANVNMNSHVIYLAILANLSSAFAANILFLNAMPSPSHHIFNRVLVLGLAARGHNVTFLSADYVDKPTVNVHYYHLEKTYETFFNGEEAMNVTQVATQTPFESVIGVPEMCSAVCEGTLESKGLEKLLKFPKDFKFDAVLYDFTFGPCLLPLVTRFNNPPLVAVTAFPNPPYGSDLVGGQKYPAYMPHYTLKYSRDMTFTQRCYSSFMYLIDWM